MNNLFYTNCPFCSKFFSYDSKDVDSTGTALLICPACGQTFAIQNAPPLVPEGYELSPETLAFIDPTAAHTTPVDGPDAVESILADMEVMNEHRSSNVEEVREKTEEAAEKAETTEEETTKQTKKTRKKKKVEDE